VDTGRAMSQENVEVVRSMLQAFADGGLDAMAEFVDPGIEWRAAEGAVDDVGEMHGLEAVRRYVQDWIDTFDDFSVVVEELRDVGDDRVLGIQRLKGRAKLSGTETDLRYALISTVRNGRVVRGREYLSVEDALEAAGLREPPSPDQNG
jgi:ketosteroid isomerase-like protein